MRAPALARPLVFVAALAMSPGAAQAAPPGAAVILSESPGLRPQLCDALRIQLADVAKVRCAPGSAEPIPARITALSEAVERTHATLGAFVTHAPGDGTVQLVVVGQRGDRAVLLFQPIRDLPEPDVDRSLALELADALDAVRRAEAQPARAGAAPPLADLLPAALARPAAQPVLGYAGFLELGGGASVGSVTQGLGRMALGARRAGPGARVEALLSAGVGGRTRQRNDAGALELRTLTAAAGLRVLWPFGPVELGGHGSVGAARIAVRGTSAAGHDASGHVLLAQLGLGLDARLRLFSTAYLQVAPQLALCPVAQRFAFDGRVALDLGRVAVELPVSLGVHTP